MTTQAFRGTETDDDWGRSPHDAPVSDDPARDGASDPAPGDDLASDPRVQKLIESTRAAALEEAEKAAEAKWQTIAQRDAGRYQSERDRERFLRQKAEEERDALAKKATELLDPEDRAALTELQLEQERARRTADEEADRGAVSKAEQAQRDIAFAVATHGRRLDTLVKAGLITAEQKAEAVSGKHRAGIENLPNEVQDLFKGAWNQPDWPQSDGYFTDELALLLKRGAEASTAGRGDDQDKDDDEPAPRRRADPVPGRGGSPGGARLLALHEGAADDHFGDAFKAKPGARRR